MKPTYDFLTALFEVYLGTHKGFVEIRTISPDGKAKSFFFTNIDELLKQLLHFKGNHIFFGVCPRDNKSGKKGDISFVTTLWLDLDYGKLGHKKESKWKTEQEALHAIEQFEFSPSIIVHSGGGLHAYWLLKEPEKIKDLNYVEGIVKGITEYLGGDAGTQNVDRILRLPGTLNIKIKDSPKPVRILKFEPDLRYDISDLENYRISIESLGLGEIDFDAKGPEASVSDLPLKSDIKELIYLGNKVKHKFPSRSERDQAVIGALVHANLNDGQIRKIFANPNYAIGDKYKEKGPQGDAYLALTIKKSRASFEAWKKEHPKDIDTILGILRKGEDGYEFYKASKNAKPGVWKPVSNFLVEYNKVIKGEEKTNIIGNLRIEQDKKVNFVWDSRIPTNPQLLKEELGKLCPTGLKFMPEHIGRIGIAIGANNNGVREYIGTDSIGQKGDFFITKNFHIIGGKIEKNEKYFVTNKNVSIYDFITKPLAECGEIAKFIVEDILPFHSFNLTLPLLGEIGRVPLIPKIADMLYVTFLRGPTGHGKSLIEKIMMNFYADIAIVTDSHQSQGIKNFRDTINHIEKHGYHLENVPMMLDDFKIGMRGSNALAIKLIQGYYNQSGRGRLTQRIEERDAHYLRCNLWMTGENLPEGEQSVMERILIYQVNSRDLRLENLPKISQKRHLLRAFTPHYIAWTQIHGPQRFEAEIKHPRLSAYIRQNLTGLKTILAFMLDNKWITQKKFDELLELGIKATNLSFDYTESSATSENVVESFLNDIRELISSKSCILLKDEGYDSDKRESYKPVIGEFSEDETKVYLMPQKTIQEACRQLHHGEKRYTAKTLAIDLKEAGYLVETEERRPSVRKKLKHGTTSVWVLSKRMLMEEDFIERQLEHREEEAEEVAKELLKEDKEKTKELENELFE